MEITAVPYRLIEHGLPTQRGNVRLSNLRGLNAIVSVTEQGGQWRGRPTRVGSGHTIYTRMHRWSKGGGRGLVFAQVQHAQIVRLTIEAVAVDRTAVTVHPDGTGALNKTARPPSASPAPDGPPRFIWLPRMFARPYRVRALTRPGSRCA